MAKMAADWPKFQFHILIDAEFLAYYYGTKIFQIGSANQKLWPKNPFFVPLPGVSMYYIWEVRKKIDFEVNG